MRIRILALAAMAWALSACAPSRLLTADSIQEPAALGMQVSRPGILRMTLRQVVSRGATGSWVREANWDEYRLTLANEGSEEITVQALELVSALPAVGVHTTSLATLDAASLDNTRFMKSLGTGFGVPGGVAGVAAAASAGMGGLVVAIVALPVVLVGGTIYVVRRSSQDGEDARLIHEELVRRGLETPATIAPGSSLHTSAFFPLAPMPRQLIVRYRVAATEQELALDLPESISAPAGKPK